MKALLPVVVAFFLVYPSSFVPVAFPKPYPDEVAESGLSPALVYSVIKAESNFCEDCISRAGAVGLMQLLPATAEFVCDRFSIGYEEERLTEGGYNVRVGTAYLRYLLGKFSERTALAAYNAGEGVVSEWLQDGAYSSDGVELAVIPYPETEQYLKKIGLYRKIYEKIR